MAGNKILLDTNIITAWLKGEKGISEKIDLAAEVYIPVIVIGELYFGAENSQRVTENMRAIRDLTTAYPVLDVNLDVAREYGKIKAELKRKGRPIPENDIWIAAISKFHTLTLITRDSHFKEVENLIIESW